MIQTIYILQKSDDDAMILLLPPPLSEGGQYILIYHDQSNMLYVPLTPL